MVPKAHHTLVCAVVSAGLLGASGCTLWQSGGGPTEQVALAEEVVAVDAAIAQVGPLTTALAYTGTTQPDQQVALRARVEGQVTLMAVDVGDRVAAGEALARLDADLLSVAVNQATAELQARQSEVAQARAAVSDAQTALETARVRLLQAQTDADRLARLAAEGAVSQQEAEQAQLTVDTAQQVLRSAAEQIRTRQEAVRAAEGRVSAQQAVVDQTEERLSYALVQSPLAGVVLSRQVETGDYVEAGDELLQIGDLSLIKVRIEVSDRDLGKVSLGQPVEVRLDAFPEQVLSGRITRIAPAADPASRLVPVEITIPNKTGRMGSGLLARVNLSAGSRDRIAISKDALTLAENLETPTVFVVNSADGKAGTLEARTVEVGRQTDERVEILSGLEPGEAIVIRSSGSLQDGQAVRLSVLSETGNNSSPEG